MQRGSCHIWLPLLVALLFEAAAALVPPSPGLSLLATGRREEPPMHQLRPGLPTPEQSSFSYTSNALAGKAKHAEAESAAEAAEAAAGRADAEEARLAASNHELVVSQAATVAALSARKLEITEQQVTQVAAETKMILGLIPEIAERAAKRAVADVRSETLQKLDAEVGQVVSSAKWMQSGREEQAADNALAKAAPYQMSKMRAAQTMWAYLSRGRELATAVAQLKKQAVEIAQVSVPLQEQGDPVHAQQLQMQARDLMDKALQMEGQAKKLQDTAASINQELPSYDAAAKAAATHGAYEANPGVIDGPFEIPQPPYPLVLPLDTLSLLSAPSPAGAPAPGPVAPGVLSPAPAASR
mmetsp:Transcript_7473/g.18961  ORF Transcript_7473/g.18961 Transcript_7473/m.18961 type:complete len:356 (+) Transcript_7473:98-1165(+)